MAARNSRMGANGQYYIERTPVSPLVAVVREREHEVVEYLQKLHPEWGIVDVEIPIPEHCKIDWEGVNAKH